MGLRIFKIQRFLQTRIGQGHKRIVARHTDRACDINAQHTYQQANIHYIKGQFIFAQVWHDYPVKVDPVHNQQPQGPKSHVNNPGGGGDDDSASLGSPAMTQPTTPSVPLAVQSIACVGPATTSASTVQFDVTLNQSERRSTPCFGLVSGGPAGAITSVAGGGANYVVTVSGVYGAGSLGLAVGGPGNYQPLAVQSDQAYTIQATTGPAAIAANGQTLQQIDPDLYDAVLSAWNADGGISRNDMIDILESADIDGSVSNQALAGLQALTQPGAASLLNEPDDVAVLAADVVQGNQANADYQGQPLGNLASQPTAEAMATCSDRPGAKMVRGQRRSGRRGHVHRHGRFALRHVVRAKFRRHAPGRCG